MAIPVGTEPVAQKLAWLFVGALVLVFVELAVKWGLLKRTPRVWNGIWVGDTDATTAITIDQGRILAHLANEGFRLKMTSYDSAASSASGTALCDIGGHRVGSFIIRKDSADPNRLTLDITREGRAATPPIVLRRAS